MKDNLYEFCLFIVAWAGTILLLGMSVAALTGYTTAWWVGFLGFLLFGSIAGYFLVELMKDEEE